MTRLHRDESGFALITALLIVAVLAVLVVVALNAGQNALTITERGSRWTRTLGVAEAGIDDAITRLGENPTSTSPCPFGTGLVCQAAGGEYQVTWDPQPLDVTLPDGTLVVGARVVTSVGYFPSKAAAQVTREIEVTLAPVESFNYTIYSASTLDIKNGEHIFGNIYAKQAVTIGQNAVVCGGIVNASGGVSLGLNAQVIKSTTWRDPQTGETTECTDRDGTVWAGGTIAMSNGGLIAGDATASAPEVNPDGTSLICDATATGYQIVGGQVDGKATACGGIVGTATGNPSPYTRTTPPESVDLPAYTFDPTAYGSDLHCYASQTTPCDQNQPLSTAVAQFQAAFNPLKANAQGEWAVWQEGPSQSTVVDLTDITLAGDLTVVTNAPIYLGNANNQPIGTVGGVPAANLYVISLYVPPPGTTCDANGGDCSIYGKNAVEIDSGDPNDPGDGVAAFFYTTGKMAFKNQDNSGDVALYGSAIDLKNGFDASGTGRLSRVVGFGRGLEPILWQELPV